MGWVPQGREEQKEAFIKPLSISLLTLSSVDREIDAAFFQNHDGHVYLRQCGAIAKKEYVNLKNYLESAKLSGIFNTAEPH